MEGIFIYKTLFFNVITTISYAHSSAMNKSLRDVFIKIGMSIGGPLIHSYYDSIVARKYCPCNPFFIKMNRWKSKGTKSRLHSEWGRTVQTKLANCSMVFQLL